MPSLPPFLTYCASYKPDSPFGAHNVWEFSEHLHLKRVDVDIFTSLNFFCWRSRLRQLVVALHMVTINYTCLLLSLKHPMSNYILIKKKNHIEKMVWDWFTQRIPVNQHFQNAKFGKINKPISKSLNSSFLILSPCRVINLSPLCDSQQKNVLPNSSH